MTARVINCAICKKQFAAPKKTGAPPTLCSDECRREARLITLRKFAEKNRLKGELRSCPICGASFIAEGKGYYRRYCSRKCSRRAEHNKRNEQRASNTPTGICPQCGEEFKRHRKKGTYCSQACYLESLKAKEQTSVCPVCGQEFVQKGCKLKYCSPLCANKAQAEVYRRNSITRRALRKTNGRIEKIIPKEIFERDGWKCQLCGKKVSKRLYKTKGTKRYPNAPSIDHIIPISKGGEHISSNVQCACYLCNCKKSNKTIGQARIF